MKAMMKKFPQLILLKHTGCNLVKQAATCTPPRIHFSQTSVTSCPSSKPSRPPGPPGLLLVGSMMSWKGPHTNLEWTQQYGDMYQVQMGPNTTVVYLNTIDLVEKYMEGVTGEQFLVRPWGPAAIAQGLLFGSGERWRKNKKVFVEALATPMFSEHMEAAINHELDIATDVLQGKAAQWGEAVKIGDVMLEACAVSVAEVLLGESLPPGSPDRKDLLELARRLERADLNSVLTNVSIKYPALRMPLSKLFLKDIADFHSTSKAYQKLFRSWIWQARRGALCASSAPAFLSAENSRDASILKRIISQPEFARIFNFKFASLTEDSEAELLQSLMDMFFGGVTSTLAGLEYILMYLTLNPALQQLAQAEIDRTAIGHMVTGKEDRQITWADREKMPYMRACITEGLRLGSVTSSTLPHIASRDTEIEGHRVAEGTVVAASIYSMHYDPQHYPDPEGFRPQRHLSEEGGGTFQSPRSYRPYGVGARYCVGDQVSEMQLFLYTTHILRRFTLLPGKEGVSTDTHMRIVHRLKDFRCVLQRRDTVFGLEP